MYIKFISKFSSDLTKNLNKMAMKKMLPFYIIFSVLFVFSGLAVMFSGDAAMGIFLISFGFLFYPIVCIIVRLIQNRLDKSMSIMSDETIETYVFTDSRFYLEQVRGECFRATTESDYSYFYKAIESATHYYLYMSKAQCHVVPKDSLAEGALGDLNFILASKLGKKFKPFVK